MGNSLRIKIFSASVGVLVFLSSNSGCHDIDSKDRNNECLVEYVNFLKQNIFKEEDKAIFKINSEDLTDSIKYYSENCLSGLKAETVIGSTDLKFTLPNKSSSYAYARIFIDSEKPLYLLYQVNLADSTILSAKIGEGVPLYPKKMH